MHKMVSEACVGLKRKRETESNSSGEVKTLKISKIDSDKLLDENPCNLDNLPQCVDEKHNNFKINTSSENHCDPENASNPAAAEIKDPKCDKSSSSSSQDGEDGSFVTDDDDNEDVSSTVSADLNSSAANDLLDISASSVNACTDDQPEKNSINDSSFQNTNKSDDVVEGKSTQSDKTKKKKRMSPEEAKLKTEERIRKQKERDLKRQETLAKKEERRLLQEKKKQEKKLALEEKQKKKELEEQLRKEKKRLEELQKEEKNKMKQLFLEAKAEEKKKKEEQKQKALEEKLKALEEKRRIEEEKKKADEEKKKAEDEKERKAKEAFANFFVRSGSSVSQAPVQSQSKEIVFRPFQVTEGMVLAPIVPPEALQRFDKEALDQCITRQNMQDCNGLYLSILKSKNYKILQTKKKSKNNPDDDEVIVLRSENAPELNLKAKLLQFCENVRPAYFGTWRKKSKNILPRNPFTKDDILDYEVDSDDEWEEGGPGESLTGTEEEESEDDYEVDNEFFVPHGYLSAEEEGEDENKTIDPEELKIRLKMKEKEFLYERKKKTTELKPVILGCFFEADGTEDILAVEKSLKLYAAELLTQNNLVSTAVSASLQNNDVASSDSPPKDNKTKVLNTKCPVPEEGMPFLIKLLHANINSKQCVIKEFQEFWRKHSQKSVTPENDADTKDTPPPTTITYTYISKRQLDITIQNISSWMKAPHPSFKKYCWWVREEIRDKYNCMDVPVPNQWNYVLMRQNSLEPSVKSISENQEQC